MNIDNHTREILQALLEGKTLLYRGEQRPTWSHTDWLGLLGAHAHLVSIAPERKITTLYTYQAYSGHWNNWTAQHYKSDTHYMQLDETGKQVAFGKIEELEL